MSKFNCLSMFANVGIAETYFEKNGINVVVANEIDKKRAKFYKSVHPNTNIIVGDITDKTVFDDVISYSKKEKVDFIIATPPCQGMSLVGKREALDPRNQLIYYAIEAIKTLKPKYAMIENVPQTLTTKIIVNEKQILIPDYIKNELGPIYNFAKQSLVRAMDYDVPQMRKRNIFLISRKDMKYTWEMPEKHKIITLRDVIYDLPSVDPALKEGYEETIKLFPDFEIKKQNALEISKWHKPPIHCKRQVEAMLHTPSGHTAFDNEIYYPKRSDGKKVTGHYNTYRRFDWDKPARTITQNNGVISSLCCVHPGKKYISKNNEVLYSDPRCLTIYELLIVFSLPTDWNIPNWADDNFIRKVIGEGIPPALVENLIIELIKNTN